MRSLFAALSVLCLGACDVPYPDNSYKPKYDADDDDDDQGDDDDEDAGAEPERDARQIPPREGGATRPDSGVARPDAQVGMQNPLAELEGRYLMRIDLYSTAEKTGRFPVLVKNRISNLLLVELVADGDALSAREFMCGQTYAHSCEDGCNTWTTTVSRAVADKYFGDPERFVDRTYRLSGKDLTGETNTLALGFDEREGNSALPEDPSDPRVWKTGNEAGLYATSNIAVRTAITSMNITCYISSAVRLSTSFSGQLTQASRDGFKDAKFTVKVENSSGSVLDVDGNSSTQCTKENFATGSSRGQQATLRMLASSAEGCPTVAEFDRELPATPAFM